MQGRLRFTVGRGPVPRHASIGRGAGLGWRSVFAQVERSRGTGPRATVDGAASRVTVGRGPVPRHACRLEQDMSRICKIYRICRIIGTGCTAGPGSRLRPRSVGRERPLSPVRAQASPNYRYGGRTNAGDRPPRYGNRDECGGQAPALRARKGFCSCAVRAQAIPNYRRVFGFPLH